MFLKAILKFLLNRLETTDEVMAQFRKSYDKLLAVQLQHTQKAEQEDVIIEQAYERRRLAANEAAKAMLTAKQLDAMINPVPESRKEPSVVVAAI